jgi:beta-glucosidase
MKTATKSTKKATKATKTTTKKEITRRQFLKAAGVASAALLAGSVVLRSHKEDTTVERELNRPMEERVEALIDQMTLDEKIQMVHGASPSKVADGYVPPIPRLGIPDLQLAYGPVGIGFPAPSTAFPATIALAATWDRELAREEGVALGNEAKAKGHDVLLAPALNIDRVPLNGRTFEYYSEDPYLTSRMVVENISGIQSEGIIAAAKHYAAHNQETGRNQVSANVSERVLREIYLPGFEAAVQEANVGSIMAAYNKVNGTYCSENGHLLTDILKDEWRFEGFVVSAWGATHSTVRAAKAGLDLEMPTGDYFGDDLRRAVQNGEVSVATLDEKVRRILRQMAISGTLDGQKKGGPGAANTPRHQELARKITANGIVLLKQEDSTLPLDPQEINSIAVIGPVASAAIVGGGGSSEVHPPYSVSILDGIQKRAAGSGMSVEYASGQTEELSPIPPGNFLAQPGDASGESGLKGEYFNNTQFSGKPTVTRVGEQVNFDLGRRFPAPGINRDGFSVRWTGTFAVPTTGNYTLALTSSGGSHLYIDDELVIDNGGEHAPRTKSYRARLEAGRPYRIRIDYHDSGGDASISFNWRTPYGQDPVELARQSDVAIVVATVGSTEGKDWDGLGLPVDQNELISDVADANDRTVVVLRTGGPVLMPWIEEVPNVLQAWYAGMEEGNAIASVLFGDVNPSGKLPVTFGKRLEDYPANAQEQHPGVDGVANYSEGIFVGYRHFDEQDIEPLFAFGHGLSYTSFAYKNEVIRINRAPREVMDAGDDSARSSGPTLEVEVEIQNTGSREGAEVVQLYLGFPETDVPMPPKQLKGFEKVLLEPGQTERVSFRLDERALSYWDTGADAWVVQSGVYRIMVGSSSQDIRLQGSVAISPSDLSSTTEQSPKER